MNEAKNLVGRRFSRWLVVGYSKGAEKGKRWILLCDCGKSGAATTRLLVGGKSGSCGCLRRDLNKVNRVGQTYGRLKVLREDLEHKCKWWCRCECGKVVSIGSSALQTGATKSCGCLTRDRLTKHGMYGTRTYESWSAMMDRCFRKKHMAYPKYGGAGITVCEKWRNFTGFYEDVGERPEGMTLDRFPNKTGNYEPGNVRWATYRQQGSNRIDNHLLTMNGRTLTAIEWARERGIKYSTLIRRVNHGGLSDLEALTTPVYKRVASKTTATLHSESPHC